MQTEDQAKGIDEKVREIMDFLGIQYHVVDCGLDAPKVLADMMECEINPEKVMLETA